MAIFTNSLILTSGQDTLHYRLNDQLVMPKADVVVPLIGQIVEISPQVK